MVFIMFYCYNRSMDRLGKFLKTFQVLKVSIGQRFSQRRYLGFTAFFTYNGWCFCFGFVLIPFKFGQIIG